MMTEAFLQFLWQHNLYAISDLKTTDGEQLSVIYCGRLNRDAGPDFLEGKIRVGDTTLVGNIELHVKASDWHRHGHQNDAAYKNLILHVVYENDVPDIPNAPTLVLQNSISPDVIARYSGLVKTDAALPCAGQHQRVKDITKESWLSRLLAERWEQKLSDWNILLENAAEDWRNLLYWRMAANFGFKTNATPFLLLAQSLPLNIPTRHKDNIEQLEALFFGQAGMLEGDFDDEYPRRLQTEFDYLRKKYSLKPIKPGLWKFLRMRPVNFPTIRIAQFAALIHKSVHLFSQIAESSTVQEIAPLLEVSASSYWNDHYKFDSKQEQQGGAKVLGKLSVENIIINTIAPIQFLYAAKTGTTAMQERALQLLEAMPAENNNIMRIWKANDWAPANAAQSQGMLQLYNNYCIDKRCLECPVGLAIIRKG